MKMNQTISCFFFLVILTIVSCGKESEAFPECDYGPFEHNGRDSLEQVVIERALSSVLFLPRAKVLNYSTDDKYTLSLFEDDMDDCDYDEDGKEIFEELLKKDPNLAKYHVINHQRVMLNSNARSFRHLIFHMNIDEYQCFQDETSGDEAFMWRALKDKYKSLNAIAWVTLPVFLEDSTVAFMEVHVDCGEGCFLKHMIKLELKGKEWELDKIGYLCQIF